MFIINLVFFFAVSSFEKHRNESITENQNCKSIENDEESVQSAKINHQKYMKSISMNDENLMKSGLL